MQIHTSDFIAWVKAQPPLAEFNWQDFYGCVSVQYLRSMLPANTNIYVLINEYYVDGVKYLLPEVLKKTFQRFADAANSPFYFVSYGRLLAEIDISYRELSRLEQEITEEV